MTWWSVLCCVLWCAGHAKWVTVATNYIHSWPLKRRVLKSLRLFFDVVMVMGWLHSLAPILWVGGSPPGFSYDSQAGNTVGAYGWSWTAQIFWWGWGLSGLSLLAISAYRHQTKDRVPVLAETRQDREDFRQTVPVMTLCSGGYAPLLRLRANEQLTLCRSYRRLHLVSWPDVWQGFKLLHISDLHLRGGVTRAYFARVFEQMARLDADIVVFTGDLLDHPACLSWVESLFSSIRAPLGCYFILGNHDWYLPVCQDARLALSSAGWIDVSERPVEIQFPQELGIKTHDVESWGQHFPDGNWRESSYWSCTKMRGVEWGRRGELSMLASPAPAIYLVGTEYPWMGKLPEIGPRQADQPRILLSHTPDVFPWAVAHEFDLVLAGHTHGGQICLPLLGPIYSPSRFSCRYAGGVYHRARTVMHVSRGVSGRMPVRWGCPPEITLIELRRADQ
ncbi:MAG: hypothetical protein KatS3mg113_0726 [Planctomycetaceae bacterium]|nr:MAG: hypothetical protein KatS3mg113_0726 [Planctomycetaceae bacterium]